MDLLKLETKDINAPEIEIDIAITKNILKFEYSNIFMKDGSYQT